VGFAFWQPFNDDEGLKQRGESHVKACDDNCDLIQLFDSKRGATKRHEAPVQPERLIFAQTSTFERTDLRTTLRPNLSRQNLAVISLTASESALRGAYLSRKDYVDGLRTANEFAVTLSKKLMAIKEISPTP
jgi:hypothetical protein